MYVCTAGAAGRTHIRDYAAETFRFQPLQPRSRGVGGHTTITTPLQRGPDKLQHGRFILNDEQRQSCRLCRQAHCLAPAVVTMRRSLPVLTGNLTLKVAPGISWLLAHMISPSCSRTIP